MDMQGILQGGGMGQQMMPGAPPSPGMPGGAAAPYDPLEFGIDSCIEGLRKLEADARRAGDEALSNEVGTMALKLDRRRLKRKSTFERAAEQGQAAVIAGQM